MLGPGRIGQVGHLSRRVAATAVDPWPLGALSSTAKASIVHLSAPAKLLETSSPLIKLRRAIDGDEREFYPLPDGSLDTADIVSWGAGSTLYLVRQYTQRATVNMSQSDPLAQPVFDPATEDAIYNGTTSWMDINGCLTSANILTAYPAVTFVSRVKRTSGSGTYFSHRDELLPVLIGTILGQGIRTIQRTTSNVTKTLTDPVVDGNPHTVVSEYNFATGMMAQWVDGIATAPIAMDMTGTLTATKTTVGATFQPQLATVLNGSLSGTAIFTSALSTADRNLITSVWNTL